MKRIVAITSETINNVARALKNVRHSTSCLASMYSSTLASRVTILILVISFFCASCNSDGQTGKLAEQKEIGFEKTKWSIKKDGQYTYRKQMITDLLNNYKWPGMKKDSLLQMLGQPDGIEQNLLMYDYERKPFLGGLGTTVEAIVFELAADSTVKVARLNDGGWD
ncbi:MAG TPA: hypothetical protein VGD17_05000 [Chitinophagaceae bacterium]